MKEKWLMNSHSLKSTLFFTIKYLLQRSRCLAGCNRDGPLDNLGTHVLAMVDCWGPGTLHGEGLIWLLFKCPVLLHKQERNLYEVWAIIHFRVYILQQLAHPYQYSYEVMSAFIISWFWLFLSINSATVKVLIVALLGYSNDLVTAFSPLPSARLAD